MSNKAVFLDRDGTINIDKGYVHTKDDFEYLPGAKDALIQLQKLGYKLIIITNQSGIGRGYFTEREYWDFDKWIRDDLSMSGINITDSFYCPHLPDAPVARYAVDCDCRKPRIGLFEQAIKKYDIDPNNSIVVGDKSRDLSICKKYPDMKGFLLYQKANYTEENIYHIDGGLKEILRALREE